MGYGIKIYQAARLEMEQRRRQAEAAAQERKDAFFLECPRAREIREEMAGAESAPPYAGAREHYILDIDNRSFSRRIVSLLEPITPYPKKKRKKELV